MGWGDGPWARYTRDVRLFGVRALPVADLVLVPVPSPIARRLPLPLLRPRPRPRLRCGVSERVSSMRGGAPVADPPAGRAVPGRDRLRDRGGAAAAGRGGAGAGRGGVRPGPARHDRVAGPAGGPLGGAPRRPSAPARRRDLAAVRGARGGLRRGERVRALPAHLRAGRVRGRGPGGGAGGAVAAGVRALWRFLAGIAGELARVRGGGGRGLPWLLEDSRAVRSAPVGRLWVRLVDVGRALAGRSYAVPLDVVLEVRDAFCPWNAGRHRLRGDGDGVAVCEPTTAPADLRLDVAEPGAAFLGGTTLAALGAAGRVEELRPGVLARTSAAFRGDREPWYPGGWAFPLY
ncbi:hypothetical protein CWE27_29455 [Streptomyces sp. EAG2]|nr:hypothetical protein CWE27_29455 [Streptomyces sp. EAG2]